MAKKEAKPENFYCVAFKVFAPVIGLFVAVALILLLIFWWRPWVSSFSSQKVKMRMVMRTEGIQLYESVGEHASLNEQFMTFGGEKNGVSFSAFAIRGFFGYYLSHVSLTIEVIPGGNVENKMFYGATMTFDDSQDSGKLIERPLHERSLPLNNERRNQMQNVADDLLIAVKNSNKW